MRSLKSLSLRLWLVWRFLWSGGPLINLTSSLALLGMVLGVAALVVSMAVLSGFEATLKQALIDMSGDVIVMRTDRPIDDLDELIPEIRRLAPEMIAYSPFIQTESLAAYNGKTFGVQVHGMDLKTVGSVLNLQDRIVSGTMDLTKGIVIGKGLAKLLEIKVGDVLTVVSPRPSETSPIGFSPSAVEMRVVGVANLGKYEYDSRFVLGSLEEVQKLRDLGSGYSGVKLKLQRSEDAEAVSRRLTGGLKAPYWTKSWYHLNENLFEAIQLEKKVIFIIVSLVVVMACFNISSTLFVNVLRRFSDMSVLATLGATPQFIRSIYVLLGLSLGLMGSVMGILVGILLSKALAHSALFLIPAEVYKLDHLSVEFKVQDMIIIVIVSMFICWISTWAPARRGARLKPVEGLRYE